MFTETNRSTMATGFGPLKEVMWTEAERRCAVVMIMTRKGDILTDCKIADLTGVDCMGVNQLRKGSDRDQGPQASRFLCTKSHDGLQEGQEGPLKSLRLASGSTRTSIWRSVHRPSLDQDSGRRSSLGAAARSGPMPCLQQVHQVAQGPLLRPGLEGLLASQQS
jgi:hypothetical protein